MIPEISIIVPVYNVERYLEKCINSILDQTFKNFEVLIIDDGSNDNSGLICDKFAESDSRIKIFHRQNEGIAKVRSFGLKQAKGKYICFVDSDDYIFESYLGCLYYAITNTNAKIAACKHINFENGDIEPCSNNPVEITHLHVKHDAIDEYIADIDNTETYVCVWNKIYEKGLWENIDFPSNKIYEDMYVWYQILDKAKDVAFIDNVLYARRLRAGSITHSSYSLEQWYMVESKIEQLYYFKNQNKQRLVEISFDSIMHFFWDNIKGMKEMNILDDKIINEYRNRIKKCVRYLKISPTYPLMKIIRQYYIAYIKQIN